MNEQTLISKSEDAVIEMIKHNITETMKVDTAPLIDTSDENMDRFEGVINRLKDARRSNAIFIEDTIKNLKRINGKYDTKSLIKRLDDHKEELDLIYINCFTEILFHLQNNKTYFPLVSETLRWAIYKTYSFYGCDPYVKGAISNMLKLNYQIFIVTFLNYEDFIDFALELKMGKIFTINFLIKLFIKKIQSTCDVFDDLINDQTILEGVKNKMEKIIEDKNYSASCFKYLLSVKALVKEKSKEYNIKNLVIPITEVCNIQLNKLQTDKLFDSLHCTENLIEKFDLPEERMLFKYLTIHKN